VAGSEQGTVTAVTGGRGGASIEAVQRNGSASGRVIRRRVRPPGGRALLGALLMALAAVGVFLAYAQATREPGDALVVVRHPIRVGEEIDSADLALLAAQLPTSTRGVTYSSFDEVVGHVALAPLEAGDILQSSAISDDRPAAAANEVAITVPREQIAVGRLKEGERVDVFVTYEARTASVVRGAEVLQIATSSDGSLTSDREVSIVVAVPSGDAVAALVHALRTGDVTVVRSTLAEPDDGSTLVYEPPSD